MSDLPVCKDCGWHDLGFRHKPDECHEEAGAYADGLRARVPNIPSTKLGYGGGNLTFLFNERCAITLNVCDDGTFSVEHIWLIGHFDLEGAAALVERMADAMRTPEMDR